MKKVKNSLIITLITVALVFSVLFALAQPPLTHRGGAAMPGEMAYATFSDFEPGDQILSAYEFEGEFYASWLQPARASTFIIRVMADDSDTPVKTGVSTGEYPFYFLLRDDKLTLLDAERTKGSWINTIVLSDTRVEIEVHDNLYFTLCPVWPEVYEVTISTIPFDINQPPNRWSRIPFFRWLAANQFWPQFISDWDIVLVTGDGVLTVPARNKTLGACTYRFHPADIERGYIELKVKVVPLANCESDNLTRNVKIFFPHP